MIHGAESANRMKNGAGGRRRYRVVKEGCISTGVAGKLMILWQRHCFVVT